MGIENEMLSRFKESSFRFDNEMSDAFSSELSFFFDNVMDTIVDYFSTKEEIKSL